MGTWRSFDTDLWNQPWFERISHAAKLLYVYSFTCPLNSQAGFARVSLKRIAEWTALDEKEVRAALGELKGHVVYLEEDGLLWTKGFLDHQCQNDSFLIAAGKSIQRDLRDESLIQEFLAYNTTHSSLSTRYPYGWGLVVTLCTHRGTTVVPPTSPVLSSPVLSSPVPVLRTGSKSTKRTEKVPGPVSLLVDAFRDIPGVTASKKDGGVIAGMVKKHGVPSIERLLVEESPSIGAADNPLMFLASRLRKHSSRNETLEERAKRYAEGLT